MNEEIKITFYESWMQSQVVDMFCKQYGNTTEQFSRFFSEFYNHPYQEKESIRIVAVSGNTVAGFASFCHWPYQVLNKTYRTLQCGNVIMNEDFRGKGIYNKMLGFVNDNHQALKIDAIIGFPIKEIVKLYLKSGWKNPFNISWYIKPVNVFSVLFPVNKNRLSAFFSLKPSHSNNHPPANKIELVKTDLFSEWHKAYNFIFDYYYFSVSNNKDFIEFSLKINVRKKVVKEMIIGDVVTNSSDPAFIKDALKKLRKAARKSGCVSFLSIAINDHNTDSPVLKAIAGFNFKKIEKDIKFIYRNFTADENELSDSKNWILYRRDLDTW